MSAIPAASVSLKTLADGTLRVSFDIEPAQAQDAFRLFAAPGTPVAIAALQVGYAAAKEPEPPKEPIGPLCNWLVIRCKEPEFWAWINSVTHDGVMWHVKDEADAKEFACELLGIESRKEVDANPDKTLLFHELIRQPFQRWIVRRGG